MYWFFWVKIAHPFVQLNLVTLDFQGQGMEG